MNNELIEQLILQRLVTWSNFDTKRFALENVNFETPKDDKPWYQVTVQNGINLMVGMADEPVTRELGALVVQIFYPSNKMTREVKRLADSLGKHFEYYMVDNLEMLTPSATNVGATDKGYQFNVRVPYRFN